MSTVIKGSASGQINLNDTTGSIQLNGSDVLTIESDNSVDIDSGTLHVDATNNRVGIGTSSPATNLVVNTTGVQGLQLTDTSTDSSPRILFTNDTNTWGVYNNVEDLSFRSGATIGSSSGTERVRIESNGDLKFNSGYGSVATAYGCRAWVNFNGTGTVAIRDSGNVSSITDSGVGDYRVNFSTAMPDTDYAVVGSCQGVSGSDIVDFGSFGYGGAPSVTPTTSQVAVGAFAYSGASVDTAIVSVAVFR